MSNSFLYINLEFPVAPNFYVFVFVMNGLKAQHVNPGCLKSILSMNISPANKNLSIMFFIFMYLELNINQTEYHPLMVSCQKEF